MANLKLDILNNINPSRGNAKTYTDLQLDLTLGLTFNNQLYKKQQVTDVIVNNNLGAIFNSIINIITTSPGQKPLNPIFGANFGDILFAPVSDARARIIGTTIFENVQKFEPRVNIINIDVSPDSENQSYTITFNISVPSFSTEQVSFKGTLDKTGFFKN
jgi:phage baseplate assembly protein W